MSRWVCGATVWAIAAAIPILAQQPSFRARRVIVRVDILVMDGNKPVTNLQPNDFEVRDQGVLQSVDLSAFEQLPVNAILALDMSGSVAGEKLDNLRRGGRALLAALKPKDRAALIACSHLVELGAPLTERIDRVRAALDRPRAGGGTALIDGSYAGLMLSESDAGRSLVIVFSDGVDTSSFLTKKAVLDIAKRSEVVVYSVAVRDQAPMAVINGGLLRIVANSGSDNFLNDLSTFTGGSVLEIASTRTVDTMFLKVLEEFRRRYLLSYSPQGVPADGWHDLKVTVKGRPSLTVKARPGYQAG